MTINSRQKGKAGELELAAVLREAGFDSKRGQQFHGGADSPDVTGIPGVHIEAKRVESGNLYNWLDQACAEAAPASLPLVCHRRNRREWVAILRLSDFIKVFKGGQSNEQ